MNPDKPVMARLGLLARLAVGGLFVYAGLMKTLAPAEEFGYAIEGYKVLNSQLSLYAAYVLPWLELWSGLMLCAGIFTRLNALFAGALLVLFEGLLGQALLRGLPVTSCGCFGSSGGNSLAREFFQNLFFLALAWLAYKKGSYGSADRYVEGL